MPAIARTDVDVSSTQTLAGKTLTTPVINGATTGTGVATSNTVSTLVQRDSSGNFAAGTITAALSGNATTATTAGNVSGTVSVANGGTGVTTLTGLVKGTGTTAMVAATAGTDYIAPDANANLNANSYIATRTSTATAAGTTTLTIASSQIQVFTGTNTQTVRLPTTGVVAGQSYVIVNNSTGIVTPQSSGGNALLIPAGPSTTVEYTARIDTPTAAADWQCTGVTGSSGALAYAAAVRDSSGWIFASGFRVTPTSTATAGGTTTLNSAFSSTQIFTGSSNQTVVLPSSSVNGYSWTIINNSTGIVTVNAQGGGTVATVPSNHSVMATAITGSPTTPAGFQASLVQPSGALAGSRVAVPASASATGVVGQWAADSSWFYVCTAANTWMRAAIATW